MLLNTRWKWKRLIPAASASASRFGIPSDVSISRQALATPFACCATSPGAFGRQRLHARKPASCASSQLAWKRTFLRSAGRDAQDGRQYTPVVRTE
jgi:hypothetical protein